MYTCLHDGLDVAVQLGLVGRVVWDGPARGAREEGLAAHIQAGAAVHSRKFVSNLILEESPAPEMSPPGATDQYVLQVYLSPLSSSSLTLSPLYSPSRSPYKLT